MVFEGEHLDSKKRAAVKVLAGEAARSPESVERFRRAARALSLLDHEHLVHVQDVGVLADGRPFCAMDLYEGETLREHLAREKGADYREALGIASKILAALEVAHSAGLVHRDIQPANVLLTSGGGLRLLDFGIASGRAIALDRAVNGPASDMVIHGTPEYLAPEQATGGDVDGRADLYAVGCLAFELMTGRLPFEGPSPVAIIDQKRKGSPPRPEEIAPSRGIPAAVSELVLKALARHPSARFQSATEMRKAIDAALSGTRVKKSRRFLGALTAVTALLAVAFGVGLVKSDQLRSRTPERVVAALSRVLPIPANPVISPDPVRTTDLDEVPLGEVALDATPHAAPLPAAAGPEENAAIDDGDPALQDPAEHDDMLVADLPDDAEAANENAVAKVDEPVAAEPAKPAPKPAKHRSKKAAPKPAPKPAKASDASNKPAKLDTKAEGAAPRSLKDMAPKKDEDAARKLKKKKVRLAKAR